MVHFFK